jgi:uncharacterized protein YbjQ (UPF0145 family)
MKRHKLILFFLMILFGTSAIAQTESTKLDTIYLLGRKKLIVPIKSISAAQVMYNDPETGESKSLERKKIQRIIYSNGRKEVFNKPVMMMVEEGDWKTVMVTKKKRDVEGLYELGKVDGKSSGGSRSARAAKKSATIRMQKRAANMGGNMVLITHSEMIGGFGEPPSYVVEGIAYSFEAPPKKENKE